jgi:hypothetical protein
MIGTHADERTLQVRGFYVLAYMPFLVANDRQFALAVRVEGDAPPCRFREPEASFRLMVAHADPPI